MEIVVHSKNSLLKVPKEIAPFQQAWVRIPNLGVRRNTRFNGTSGVVLEIGLQLHTTHCDSATHCGSAPPTHCGSDSFGSATPPTHCGSATLLKCIVLNFKSTAKWTYSLYDGKFTMKRNNHNLLRGMFERFKLLNIYKLMKMTLSTL